jgi:hypothetical protein
MSEEKKYSLESDPDFKQFEDDDTGDVTPHDEGDADPLTLVGPEDDEKKEQI